MGSFIKSVSERMNMLSTFNENIPMEMGVLSLNKCWVNCCIKWYCPCGVFPLSQCPKVSLLGIHHTVCVRCFDYDLNKRASCCNFVVLKPNSFSFCINILYITFNCIFRNSSKLRWSVPCHIVFKVHVLLKIITFVQQLPCIVPNQLGSSGGYMKMASSPLNPCCESTLLWVFCIVFCTTLIKMALEMFSATIRLARQRTMT